MTGASAKGFHKGFFSDANALVALGTDANASFIELATGGTTLYKIQPTGAMLANNFVGTSPRTTTTNTTISNTESTLICNGSGSLTITLPTASSFPGRTLYIKTIAAQTVVSASSNVVPRTTATAGTAICTNVAGSWAELQSDGTNWVIMAGA